MEISAQKENMKVLNPLRHMMLGTDGNPSRNKSRGKARK